jgi:prepilin-type N-terminal cleavage/methylation domain-containing protein
MHIDETFNSMHYKAGRRALVLMEMLVVLVIIGLMTALTTLNFSSAFTRAKFCRDTRL